MSRKVKWAGAILLVGAATGAGLFLWPRDSITPETCQSLRHGMSREEVEGVLGAPGQSCDSGVATLRKEGVDVDMTSCWFGRQGAICVSYDDDKRVKTITWWGWHMPSFLDRLRSWLRR